MSYCMTKVLAEDPAACEAKARAALMAQGFGILTEIDVAATLRTKIGVEIGTYKILGACNPTFAKGAIDLEARVGVMLPCNVVLRGIPGGTEVSVVDPVASMAAIDNAALKAHAETVRTRLLAAFEALA